MGTAGTAVAQVGRLQGLGVKARLVRRGPVPTIDADTVDGNADRGRNTYHQYGPYDLLVSNSIPDQFSPLARFGTLRSNT